MIFNNRQNSVVGAACLWLLTQTLQFSFAEVYRETHRTFADSLTNALYAKDNECTSTWGASMMLDLLRTGGTQETKQQLCDIISLCGPTQQQDQQILWNDAVTSLVAIYNGSCTNENTNFEGETQCRSRAPLLEIANSVWIDVKENLKTSYDEVVGDYLIQTNFSDKNAGSTVNAWANASTRGLIDSIIDEGPIPYTLLAINSIFLSAQWKSPFSDRLTNQDSFYSSSDRAIALKDANFMHKVEFFAYSHELIPGYQILKLPYSSSSLSMVLVLPVENNSVSINSTELHSILPSLKSTRVALALPKFRFESEYEENLKQALQDIGLSAPFDRTGGFCDIFEDSCESLDLVKQKTVIDVNEFGTKAAAVTVGALERALPKPQDAVLFMADHPFQFFLYDEGQDLAVFEGRLGAPEIYNSGPSRLKAKHSDQDFWSRIFRVNASLPIGATGT